MLRGFFFLKYNLRVCQYAFYRKRLYCSIKFWFVIQLSWLRCSQVGINENKNVKFYPDQKSTDTWYCVVARVMLYKSDWLIKMQGSTDLSNKTNLGEFFHYGMRALYCKLCKISHFCLYLSQGKYT